MKNKFLILGLILGLLAPVFAGEISDKTTKTESGGIVLIASIKKTSPPRRKFIRNYSPFNRQKYGTLTGYTPPVGSLNNYFGNDGWRTSGWSSPWGSGSLWTNNYYYDPVYTSNSNLSTRLKRFFNPNYNNHYQNSPGYTYNPYLNGNYNNLQNKRYIPLYNGTGGANGYQNFNGLNLDTNTNSSGGATVTIID